MTLSWAWVVALAIVGCRAAPVARDASGIAVLDHVPAGDVLDLNVRVVRWSCTVTDGNGVRDDVLHVPTERVVRLFLTNADGFEDLDVAVAGTTVDLPRGAVAPIVFRIDRPGTYRWECPTQVPPKPDPTRTARPIIASSPTDYAVYQVAHREATRPTTREGKLALGKQLAEKKGCIACHTVDGSPKIGPSWAGIWGTTVTLTDGRTRTIDAAYVRESILTPQAVARPGYPPVMPAFEGQLRAEELDAFVAYIEALGATP